MGQVLCIPTIRCLISMSRMSQKGIGFICLMLLVQHAFSFGQLTINGGISGSMDGDLTTDLSIEHDVCLAVDSDYALEFKGSAPSSAFSVESTATPGKYLDYSVEWKPAGAGSYSIIGVPALPQNFSQGGLPATSDPEEDCLGVNEMSTVKLVFLGSSARGIPQGGYSGSLELIVTASV